LRLHFFATASSVRFRVRGIWRQALEDQLLKLGYWSGFSLKKMIRHYEKGLELNKKVDGL
jgi:hypothetical protein